MTIGTRARSIAVAIGAGILVAACGGSAALSTPSPTPTASATATATAAVTTGSAGAWTVSDKSKATISVREQLVGGAILCAIYLASVVASGPLVFTAYWTAALVLIVQALPVVRRPAMSST